jgi:cytochrome c oxidase cbb3-type subunit 3
VRKLPAIACLFLLLALSACQREERNFRGSPPFGGAVNFEQDFQGNAYALSEGKNLFKAFNCSGCHANGGGGMGPPLMDEKWLYGYEPQDIYQTITGGRPGGMPAFGGKIESTQVWQLVAYVRSMSGLGDKSANPGRDDAIKNRPPENTIENPPPVVVPPPPDGTTEPMP